MFTNKVKSHLIIFLTHYNTYEITNNPILAKHTIKIVFIMIKSIHILVLIHRTEPS